MAGFCEQGSETGGSIKCKGCVEELRKCWLLKKHCAPWRWLVTATKPSQPLSKCVWGYLPEIYRHLECRGELHCHGQHSLSKWAFTVEVNSHCQGQYSLLRGAFTGKVNIHCQGPHILSRSSFIVSVSIRCQGQHSLSRSAFTVEDQHSLPRSAFTVEV